MLYIESLRQGLRELLKSDETIYLIGEDIVDPYGGAFKVTKGLSSEFPGRVFATPMSEQAIVGLGTGLALNGLKPIVEIMFSDFLTLACDQLVNHAAKFHQMYKKKLHLVVRSPSGGYRGYGATHSQSMETIYMSIPGIDIICPSVFHDPASLLKKSVYSGVPTLFIEHKLDYSRTLITEHEVQSFYIIQYLELGKTPVVHIFPADQDVRISLITYGGMAYILHNIQKYLLTNFDLPVELFVVSDLRNTNYSSLADFISANKILLVQESWEKFGWGSFVGFNISSKKRLCHVYLLGALDYYIPASQKLENYVLPSDEKILNFILKVAEETSY